MDGKSEIGNEFGARDEEEQEDYAASLKIRQMPVL